MSSSFEKLVQNLFQASKKLDYNLGNLKSIAQEIHDKYKPRSQFHRWRNSQEGQIWKQQQYQNQNGCCAICQSLIVLKGSHIDHIKPLSLYPHLAIDIHNMQITCSDCNISKANKIN